MMTALTLAQQGFPSIILESSSSQPSQDARHFALSPGSSQFLQGLGVPLGPYCPIHSIGVEASGKRVVFKATDIDSPFLGSMVWAADLRVALYQMVQRASGIEYYHDASLDHMDITADFVRVTTTRQSFQTSWVLGCDGRQSRVRDKAEFPVYRYDYKQQGEIFTIYHPQPHHFRAQEHFFSSGPLAILPLLDQHCSTVVWSHSLGSLSNSDWTAALSARMPSLYQGFSVTSAVQRYPLHLIWARKIARHRCLLLGDSAHSLHPVAGQGLNVGIRDIATLGHIIHSFSQQGDPWENSRLHQQYSRKRRREHRNFVAMTHGLIQWFALCPPSMLTKMGLMGSRLIKTSMMRYAMQ